MIAKLKFQLIRLGVLRGSLLSLSAVLIVLTPFSDLSLPPEGWDLVWSIVIPAAVPVVFMVLMLDLMMCQIWKDEVDAEESLRLVWISKLDLIAGLLLLLVWLPVFMQVTNR